MASIETFVEEVGQLVISGVTRQYIYPPLQISTADLPASFVRPPRTAHAQLATCDEVGDVFTVQLVIAIEPTGQNVQPSNYAALLTMLDNVNTALKGATFTNLLPASWTLAAQDSQPIILSNAAFWGVIATITAQGAN